MIPPFVICLVFFTFVFLVSKIVDITKMIVNYNVSLNAVIMMLIYSIPYFLVFVIPMSVMMTVLFTFLRMSGDNEIVVLKAGGMSISRLLPPVFLICLIGFLATVLMAVYGLPWSSCSIKRLTLKIASSNIDAGLKERTFIDNFPQMMLYVNKIDLKNKKLKDIFIEDQRAKDAEITIVAPSGRLFKEKNGQVYHLRLYNGTIDQVSLKDRSVHSMKFDTYNIRLDLKRFFSEPADRQKRTKEMSLAELSKYIKNSKIKNSKYYNAQIELHKKFSIPFACFVLGFLAVPLGIQSKSSKRSFGLGLGLVFFLLYYLLLSAGKVFGESGAYPPAIGMWVPNIVIGVIGLYLFKITLNERPVSIDFFSKLANILSKTIKKEM